MVAQTFLDSMKNFHAEDEASPIPQNNLKPFSHRKKLLPMRSEDVFITITTYKRVIFPFFHKSPRTEGK